MDSIDAVPAPTSASPRAEAGWTPAMSAVLAAFVRPARRPATPEELQALEGARREDVAWRGERLALWRWGSGRPVLLLHGWESRASHLAGFVAPLLQAGFGVAALDAPAHGESGGRETNVFDYAQVVAALGEALGAGTAARPLAGVVAHSVGSAAALGAFAQGLHADASVHLCGPSALTRVVERVSQLARLTPEQQAQVAQRIAERIGAPLAAMDLAALQAGLRHPALLLHDPQDPEVPADESLHLSRHWPGASLVWTPGTGHRRILRDPTVVERSVAFLARRAVA